MLNGIRRRCHLGSTVMHQLQTREEGSRWRVKVLTWTQSARNILRCSGPSDPEACGAEYIRFGKTYARFQHFCTFSLQVTKRHTREPRASSHPQHLSTVEFRSWSVQEHLGGQWGRGSCGKGAATISLHMRGGRARWPRFAPGVHRREALRTKKLEHPEIRARRSPRRSLLDKPYSQQSLALPRARASRAQTLLPAAVSGGSVQPAGRQSAF